MLILITFRAKRTSSHISHEWNQRDRDLKSKGSDRTAVNTLELTSFERLGIIKTDVWKSGFGQGKMMKLNCCD